MKKIGLIVKDATQTRIKDGIKDSEAIFIVQYSGLSSPHLTALRQNLKNTNAKLFIIKNSVARKAFSELGIDNFAKAVDGPCGLVFSKDEPVGVSKVLCNFSKEHESLLLQGGLFKDKLLEKKDIEALAKLPSKDVLRAQAVMTLKGPIVGLVMTLSQLTGRLVFCLEQVKNKKEN